MMTFKILGLTDERTECECCGRSGLKSTVALEYVTTGDITYYGRDCAAKAMRGTNKAANVKAIEDEARGVDYARKWLGLSAKHTATVVANFVRVRFCACHSVGEFSIQFPSGTTVSA